MPRAHLGRAFRAAIPHSAVPVPWSHTAAHTRPSGLSRTDACRVSLRVSMAAPPTPQPFHLAASGLLKRPLCSTQGIAPWRLPAPRADGSDMNDVTCVRIYDATRVSKVYG